MLAVPKLTLIDDWRRAWRLVSVHVMALGAAIQGAWIMLPDEFQDAIEAHLSKRAPAKVAVLFFVAGVLGRLLKQKEPPPIQAGTPATVAAEPAKP